MLFTVLSVSASSLNAAPTSQLDLEKYFTIDRVELYQVVDGREVYLGEPDPAPTLVPTGDKGGPVPGPTTKPGGTVPTGGLGDLGTIITIGEKIWQIIEKNRPVVTQNYATVSAVPAGIKTWDELGGWSETVTRTFKIVYTNLYRQKVAEFEYRVAYSFGGNYEGKGKYLSQVTIEPKILNVGWGYKFNANGVVANVKNVGTKDAPVASMDLVMNWSVDSVMKHMQESVRFQLNGDGLFKDLSSGTIAAESRN
jgi:hypothetical protein